LGVSETTPKSSGTGSLDSAASQRERDMSEFLRQIFDASIDGMLWTASHGRILAANAAACTRLGRAEAELLAAGHSQWLEYGFPAAAAGTEEHRQRGRVRQEVDIRRPVIPRCNRTFFWNSIDLHRKLGAFRRYYNGSRAHCSLDGHTPGYGAGNPSSSTANPAAYDWESHCNGLFEIPVAA
jgi:PAS domain-containing protein